MSFCGITFYDLALVVFFSLDIIQHTLGLSDFSYLENMLVMSLKF